MPQWRNPRCLVHYKGEKKIGKRFKDVKTPAIRKTDHFNGCITFVQHEPADRVGIISAGSNGIRRGGQEVVCGPQNAFTSADCCGLVCLCIEDFETPGSE